MLWRITFSTQHAVKVMLSPSTGTDVTTHELSNSEISKNETARKLLPNVGHRDASAISPRTASTEAYSCDRSAPAHRWEPLPGSKTSAIYPGMPSNPVRLALH